MTIRILYNILMCRLGFRNILPRDYINSIHVNECGEELVDYQGMKVRTGIAEKLTQVTGNLHGTPYSIKVVSGYRTLTEQTILWKRAGGDRRFSADPTAGKGGGHQTGGAVDVILLKDGKEVDMGCRYLEHSETTATINEKMTAEQSANRKLLCKVMHEAGFVNYPAEWWHFCYGDQIWAAYKNKTKAIYGKI